MNLGKTKKKIRSSPENPLSLPHRFNRKETFIFPTRFGFLFIIVLVGMLIGSVNYNNNLGFLLTFLLGSITLISMFHTSANLSGIELAQVRCEPVFAGDPAVFEFVLRTPQSDRPEIIISLAGGKKKTRHLRVEDDNRLKLPLPTEKRGLLSPGRIDISTFYPVGLFCCWTRVWVEQQCLVYPRPMAISDGLSTGETAGDGEQGRPGSGSGDFHGLRPYQPGDSFKHVSWKAYSRGQGLLTKMFEQPAMAGIVLDWYRLKETDTEKKLSKLCFLVLKAHRLNIDYGLSLPGKQIAPGSGEPHKHKCLKALALFGPENPEGK